MIFTPHFSKKSKSFIILKSEGIKTASHIPAGAVRKAKNSRGRVRVESDFQK